VVRNFKFQTYRKIKILIISALYCSRNCLLQDERELHSVHCRNSNNSDSNTEMATRIGARSVQIYNRGMVNGVDEVCQLAEDTKLYNVFDFDFNSYHDLQYCKNMTLAALGGQKSSKKIETVDKTDFQLYKKYVLVNLFERSIELFYHLEPYLLLTKKAFNEGDPFKDSCEDDIIGSNIGWIFHPLEHMFNTSCHPNLQVARFTENGVSAWIVKYPVKAGEQLFKSYQPENPWLRHSKSERQKVWKETYGFKCECKACVNDWKISEIRDDINAVVAEPSIKPEKGLKKFKENCNYINKNYNKEYPSGELKNKK
jgi:hypothetical protein